MPKKFVFETEVKRDVTCASCGTHYYYLYKVRSEGTSIDAARAGGLKQMSNGFSWVPCPRCGKMTAQMRRGHLLVGLFLLPLLAVSIYGVFHFLDDARNGRWPNPGGSPYILFGEPFAIPAALLFLGMVIAWPFMPRFNRGAIPGEEDKLPPKLRARIEAFNRRGPTEPQVRPA